jgi:hypothetical protein
MSICECKELYRQLRPNWKEEVGENCTVRSFINSTVIKGSKPRR